MTDVSRLKGLLTKQQEANHAIAKLMSHLQKKYAKKTREFLVVGCDLHGRTASKLLRMADVYNVIDDKLIWTALGWPYIGSYVSLTTASKRKKLRAKVIKASGGTPIKSPRSFLRAQGLVPTKVEVGAPTNELLHFANEMAGLINNGYGFIFDQLSKPSQKLVTRISKKRKARAS